MNFDDYPVGTLFTTTATHILFETKEEVKRYRLISHANIIELISVPCFILSKEQLPAEPDMQIWHVMVEEKVRWILVHINVIKKFFTKISK